MSEQRRGFANHISPPPPMFSFISFCNIFHEETFTKKIHIQNIMKIRIHFDNVIQNMIQTYHNDQYELYFPLRNILGGLQGLTQKAKLESVTTLKKSIIYLLS